MIGTLQNQSFKQVKGSPPPQGVGKYTRRRRARYREGAREQRSGEQARGPDASVGSLASSTKRKTSARVTGRGDPSAGDGWVALLSSRASGVGRWGGSPVGGESFRRILRENLRSTKGFASRSRGRLPLAGC